MRFGRCIGVANRQVKAFTGQVHKPVGQRQLHRDVRKTLQKTGHARAQMLASQCHRSGHPNQAPRCAHQVAHAAVAVVDACKRRLKLGHQLLTGFGQPHRAGGAPHQRHAGSPLQLADAGTGRRFGQPQAARCFGKTLGGGQHGQQMQVGYQRRQLIGRHGRCPYCSDN